jgi:hypothetical protein
MNTVSSLVLHWFDAPDTDRSLPAISLLSCIGLVVSFGLMGFGFDPGAGWI